MLLTLVALAGCYIPARRTARVDSMVCVRGLKRPRRPKDPTDTIRHILSLTPRGRKRIEVKLPRSAL